MDTNLMQRIKAYMNIQMSRISIHINRLGCESQLKNPQTF